MKTLCSLLSASELAVVESLLRAEAIPFFVHNEHFGALQVGPSIPMVNERTVLVADEDFERAVDAIRPPPDTVPEPPTTRHLPFAAKVRMVLEALLFVWLVPGSRRRRRAIER